MADALISALVEQLVSFTAQKIQQEWSLVSGTKKKVEGLANTLEAIKAVLEEAEKRQITEADVGHWLRRLKGVSFEIDAALDEWNTAITLRSNMKPVGKLIFFAQSSVRFDHVHRVGLRRRIAIKIDDLNEKLKTIALERQSYNFVALGGENIVVRSKASEQSPPQTTSFIDMSEVDGREKEKKVLVSKLLSENCREMGGGYEIIPIVGTGGIGKTTLAQLAFGVEQVCVHFECKIWVCVSDTFDELKIARAILEALKVQGCHNLAEFESLLQCLRDSITGKRFLLVLDDVWTEDDRKWCQLENCLASGGIGSKILVTSRKKEVAMMMKAEENMITLQYLSDEVCWSIFHRKAFFGKEKSEELEVIGRQISNKSKGLPLVAKTLGSLMRFKDYCTVAWEKVQDDELWKLKDIENKVFVPLLFSYYNLPSLEKLCLLYCSYFPKDYTIDRNELIQLWSSEGYLNVGKCYEKKGIDCYENLARLSFFQNFERDREGDVVRCKMHDIVHDFVLFLSRNEWLHKLISAIDGAGMEAEDDNGFHCTLLMEPEARIPNSIYKKMRLRTLNFRGCSSSEIEWDSLLKLTCLRTLTLVNCKIEHVPKKIDQLIHLRYLNLNPCWGHSLKLPSSLYNLINLRTLKLEGNVTELPDGIEKLIYLRHLCLQHYTLVPRGLRKLTCLETLQYVKVGDYDEPSNQQRWMKLEDLSKLNNLKGTLDIFDIGNVEDVGEAERANLKDKQGLHTLKFRFQRNGYFKEQETFLLEGLQPHPSIKHVTIEFYGGVTMFPGWMTSLINLKSLNLYGCRYLKFLGPLGMLPSFEWLTLNFMQNIERIGGDFLGITKEQFEMKNRSSPSIILFPKLRQLEFKSMYGWEEWEEPSCCSELTIMPCLVSLTIEDCLTLKAPLPEFLQRTPLQSLTIAGCQFLGDFRRRGTEAKMRDNQDCSISGEVLKKLIALSRRPFRQP